MESIHQSHWILEEIAEERAPRSSIDLWSKLEANLLPKWQDLPRLSKRHQRIKKIFLYTAIFLVCLLGALITLVPSVRAQVKDWINNKVSVFYFRNGFGRSSVGLFDDGSLGFIPLTPNYLPAGKWDTVPDLYEDKLTGAKTLVLIMNMKGDRFIVLTQHKAVPQETLPGGKSIRINGKPATLAIGLVGEVDAGIPLDKKYGGVQPEPSGQIQLSPIRYTNGVKLSWQDGDIQFAILSNLTQRQVLKIAASMRPVAIGPGEIITSEP